MAKSNELNIDVNVRLSVPDEVAERIMTLLAMYLDEHPNKDLIMECDDNGKHRGRVKDRDEPEIFPEWDLIAVQAIPSYTEPIYLETSWGLLYAVQYQYTDEKREAMMFRVVRTEREFEEKLSWPIEEYRKSWRCWDKPMSVKDREAVKWE